MSTVVVSTNGTSGPRGNGWLTGSGVPSNSVGFDGDFYINQADPDNPTYWGPKTAGVWTGHGPYIFAAGGGISSVTAVDGSIVVNNTDPTNPTVRTGTLDVVATQHPPAADWSNNNHKITGVTAGTASGQVAVYQQIPTSLPPSGAAGGDLLGSTYPNPIVAKINGVAISGTAAAGKALVATSAGAMSWLNADFGAWVFNVQSYGAVGDGKFTLDGAISATSSTLTCASGPFTIADVTKLVMVKGSAAAGVTTSVGTITAYLSATQVTVSFTAAVTVTSALVMWATDDTSAFIAAAAATAQYAGLRGTGDMFVPVGSGYFYGIGGALQTGGTTLGNAQIPIPPVVNTAFNKSGIKIRGVGNGSGLAHWLQEVPQLNGSTLVSFGVFSSSSAQTSNINANGNACVIGGPTQTNGFGVAPGVFSNTLITIENLSVLTTYSLNGLTYSAFDFSGLAEANLFNVAWGTTGVVPGGDFGSPASFANGLAIGCLMPANGNNDNNACNNISVHGGYTWGWFATEHTNAMRVCILYCWSALAIVGTYFTSVGATHGVVIGQFSVEGNSNVVYGMGVGSGGIGPFVQILQLSTESGSTTFADNTSGNGLAAMLGTVNLAGLYTPAAVNTSGHPTGLNIVNGQQGSPANVVTGTYQFIVTDRTILADATGGAFTTTLISAAWTPNVLTVKKIDSTGNAVTVSATGGELIHPLSGAAATTITLAAQGNAARFEPARVSGVWGWYQVP